MKYAICNEVFEERPFDESFNYVRECGYTGIEIAPFTISPSAYDISAARRDEVKNLIVDTGLECVGLHYILAKTEGFYLTTPDEDVRKATGDYLAELSRLCRDLDGKIMVLGSPAQRNLLPGISHDQAMEFAANTIRRAMPKIEDNGVTLALEPLGPGEGNFLNTAELGVQLAEMVDSSHCKLHLDVKAMSTEEIPIDEVIRKNSDWMVHFHANDPNMRGPGMGDVDFEPIFIALEQVGYDGWVSVEVFDYEPGIEALVKGSLEYMEEVNRKID